MAGIKEKLLGWVFIGCCLLPSNTFAGTADFGGSLMPCEKIPNSPFWRCSLQKIGCVFECGYACYKETPESHIPTKVYYLCNSGLYSTYKPVCTPAEGRRGCAMPMMPREYCLNLLDELRRIFCNCKPPDPARCELEFKLLDAIFLP